MCSGTLVSPTRSHHVLINQESVRSRPFVVTMHGVSVSFVSSQQRSQAEAVCHDKVERDIRNRSQLDLQTIRY